MGEAGGNNLYEAFSGDPINLFDYLGLDVDDTDDSWLETQKYKPAQTPEQARANARALNAITGYNFGNEFWGDVSREIAAYYNNRAAAGEAERRWQDSLFNPMQGFNEVPHVTPGTPAHMVSGSAMLSSSEITYYSLTGETPKFGYVDLTFANNSMEVDGIVGEDEAQGGEKPWYQPLIDEYDENAIRTALPKEKLNQAIQNYTRYQELHRKAANKLGEKATLKDMHAFIRSELGLTPEAYRASSSNRTSFSSGIATRGFSPTGNIVNDFVQAVSIGHEQVHDALRQSLIDQHGSGARAIWSGAGSGRMWANNEVRAYEVSIDRTFEFRDFLYP